MDNTVRVLIVEDAPAVAALLDAALSQEGMVTAIAASGEEAMAKKAAFRPSVVLIDLGLPDLDGLTLVRLFAADRDCGVIVVTSNDAETTRVAGLETGADDYMVKPVALRELAARVRAVQRRIVRGIDRPADSQRVLLDSRTRSLHGPGQARTPLTEAECLALETLLDAAGQAVSRERLGRAALRRPLGEDDRSVDQLMLKLRRKLSRHGMPERAILSTRGLGYQVPEPQLFVRPPRGERSIVAGSTDIAPTLAANDYDAVSGAQAAVSQPSVSSGSSGPTSASTRA